jgi:hypothetical protein
MKLYSILRAFTAAGASSPRANRCEVSRAPDGRVRLRTLSDRGMYCTVDAPGSYPPDLPPSIVNYAALTATAKGTGALVVSAAGEGRLRVNGAAVAIESENPWYADPPLSAPSAAYLCAAERIYAGSRATDKDRAAMTLAGALLCLHSDGCTVASTDGKWLMEAGPVPPQQALQVILPPEALSVLTADRSAVWRVRLGDEHRTGADTRVDGCDVRILTRGIEGVFPAYRQALTGPAVGSAWDFPLLARVIAHAAEGARKAQRNAMVVSREGAWPLSEGAGGRAVACAMPFLPETPLAFDAAYVAELARALRGVNVTAALGRGIVVRSAELTGLIMPRTFKAGTAGDVRLPAGAVPLPEVAPSAAPKAESTPSPVSAEARIAELEAEVAALRAQLEKLR